MAILDIENSLVLIIDVQEKLLNASFNKELIKKKSEIIAKTTSILNIPVIVTEQYPKGLGETTLEIKNNLSEKALFFEKTSFSALDDENIFENIKSTNKKQIVVFGIETHICVNQTVSALIHAGYDVHVVKDACGSRAESEFFAGIERMKNNGASILTTEILLFEWLKTSKHPSFKEIQNLIK